MASTLLSSTVISCHLRLTPRDIERNLDQVRTWMTRWSTLQTTDQFDDCIKLEETVIQTLKDVMWDADQLAETIAITQQNNVYNITANELESRLVQRIPTLSSIRKKFVSGVRKTNNEIMKTIKEAVQRRVSC